MNPPLWCDEMGGRVTRRYFGSRRAFGYAERRVGHAADQAVILAYNADLLVRAVACMVGNAWVNHLH